MALLGLVLALVAAVIAGCGDDDDDGDASGTATATETAENGNTGGEVAVELAEFSVMPVPTSVAAGEVAFAAENVGTTPHNLLVIRTDLALDALPVEGATVDESQLDVALSIEELNGGESGDASVGLEAGSYVLICNTPGHYSLGMTSAFIVE
jgi:uncharacterized cupredoxin-like copper-binding protein